MNFFESQEKAQRSTIISVVLFILAVAGIIAITNGFIHSVMVYNKTGFFLTSWDEFVTYFDQKTFISISVIVLVLVLGGAAYKMIQLSAGGPAIAVSLGGRLIPQASQDPDDRKVLNVVEEMAIASGSTVPPVYVIPGSGINAFAAGFTPSDAVIGLTRGAVQRLTRDELQGVIAHEFSHIFNGDMRLNIRLAGFLHGILLIGMIGYYILRSMRHVRSSGRSKDGGSAILAILVLGFGLMAIGFIGTLFGEWIKAIVSRQREYLADASAVQFTRNPEGIANALKKIGGSHSHGLIDSPAAPEFSHAYFAEGASSFMGAVFATHPPLKKRIRAIQPGWNGKFIKPTYTRKSPSEAKPTTSEKRDAKLAVAAGVAEAMFAIEIMGNPALAHIEQARDDLKRIPVTLKEATQNPLGAQLVVLALLTDGSTEMQSQQWNSIGPAFEKEYLLIGETVIRAVQSLESSLRVVLVDLAMPTLRTLSKPQYQLFRAAVKRFVEADKKLSMFEWVVMKLVIHHLDVANGWRKPYLPKHNHLGAIKPHAEIILSMLAYMEHRDDTEAEVAFKAGAQSIGATALKYQPRAELTLAKMSDALDQVGNAKPMLKARFLKACVACANVDKTITVSGTELLRVIAAVMDTPLPPLLHEQS